MKRTPFFDFHQQNGAKFVDFAGYEMPIHYGSILAEHQQVRTSGGLFDVSHMGRLKITGRHARKFLERVLTRKISDMNEKQCRYALICNERGGVVDDILVYRFADHWLLVVNAANRQKVLDHFKAVQGADVVTIDDQTDSTAMVAVQGPKVIEMIGNFSSEIPTLKRYAFTTKNLLILKLIVSRTGYTGEDGVEVIMGAGMASMAIKLLLKDKAEAASVKPAGLGARDTLRMEAGMPLYGHELDEETDPLSAGLGFAVSLDKGRPVEDGPEIPRFIGQDALEQVAANGPGKKLIGIRFDGKRTPRQGMDVLSNGRKVGVVTSGCLSPTLGYPIAMAYVEPGAATVGDAVAVAVGSGEAPGTIVALPFYQRPKAPAAAAHP